MKAGRHFAAAPVPVSVMARVTCCVLLVTLLSVPTVSLAQPLQWIDVEGAAGAKLRAAVFRPSGDGPFPIVMLLHGSEGLSAPVVDWGPDLAHAGFLAVAGCLFRRDAAREPAYLCSEAPDRQRTFAVRNLAALIEAARRLPGVQRDQIGLVGWSWGGALALLTAGSGVDVQAVVAVAGAYNFRLSDNDPSALSVVDRLSAPVLILHGTMDNIVPVRTARSYEARVRELGKSIEAQYIEGADHDLWLDPRFRTDVIGRTVTFLQRHFGR